MMNWKLEIKEAGIPIRTGMGCPILIFFLTPGLSLHDALVLLEKSGLDRLEILKTATLNPARYFNMEDLGLVKEGVIADLLLLRANPLDDIRNTTKIEAVVKDGKVHDRMALDALLESLD